jgi:hypothetical protein
MKSAKHIPENNKTRLSTHAERQQRTNSCHVKRREAFMQQTIVADIDYRISSDESTSTSASKDRYLKIMSFLEKQTRMQKKYGKRRLDVLKFKIIILKLRKPSRRRSSRKNVLSNSKQKRIICICCAFAILTQRIRSKKQNVYMLCNCSDQRTL